MIKESPQRLQNELKHFGDMGHELKAPWWRIAVTKAVRRRNYSWRITIILGTGKSKSGIEKLKIAQ